MITRKPSPHWALWVFALALLLKSALPLLASASAQWQGKALVEVCTVYGVAQVAPAGESPAPAGDGAGVHGAAHCALSALAALATPMPPAQAAWPDRPAPAAPHCAHAPPAPDASASWIARRKHGPPGIA